MTTDIALKHNGETIDYLRECLSNSEHGMSGLATAIRLTVKDRAWEARRDPRTGNVYECGSFVELVTAPPLKGLGWEIAELKRFCQDDKEALEIIDRETTNPQGRHHDNVMMIPRAEQGNAVEYALRKLREDAPSLHRDVIAGKKSPHAAMVEAGFRRKTITVPVDPERAARTIARHFSPDELRDLISELSALVDWRP